LATPCSSSSSSTAAACRPADSSSNVQCCCCRACVAAATGKYSIQHLAAGTYLSGVSRRQDMHTRQIASHPSSSGPCPWIDTVPVRLVGSTHDCKYQLHGFFTSLVSVFFNQLVYLLYYLYIYTIIFSFIYFDLFQLAFGPCASGSLWAAQLFWANH
jgi:hypothetical protein